MDEELDGLLVRVRADTGAFAADVAAMRATLEGPLTAGADRAGQAIETALVRAVRTGKLGFEDLKAVALSALSAISNAAVRSGIEAIFSGGGSSGGGGAESGLLSALTSLFGGAPGRATGGPVSPGRPYWVGERGPELFVPTASGNVAVATGMARDVRIAITVNTASGEAPAALARSSRQVARAVKAALEA